MAYSVVGKDFYMRHRNFDGSDVLATEGKEAIPDPSSIDVTNQDDVNDPFTKDQISWFGMSRLVTGLFKGFKKDVKQYLTQLNLYLQFENDVQFVTCVYHQHQFCFSSKQSHKPPPQKSCLSQAKNVSNYHINCTIPLIILKPPSIL